MQTNRPNAATGCAHSTNQPFSGCNGSGYLSLHPETDCPGCGACQPSECPRCLEDGYYSAGRAPGCIHCGYLAERDDCVDCGDPCGEDGPAPKHPQRGEVVCDGCADEPAEDACPSCRGPLTDQGAAGLGCTPCMDREIAALNGEARA